MRVVGAPRGAMFGLHLKDSLTTAVMYGKLSKSLHCGNLSAFLPQTRSRCSRARATQSGYVAAPAIICPRETRVVSEPASNNVPANELVNDLRMTTSEIFLVFVELFCFSDLQILHSETIPLRPFTHLLLHSLKNAAIDSEN